MRIGPYVAPKKPSIEDLPAYKALLARVTELQAANTAFEERAREAERKLAAHQSFQTHNEAWMDSCFGPEISKDMVERRQRFTEEAIELGQAIGGTADEAHALVDYVYSRPIGDPKQEVGGVMVTVAAICSAAGLDMIECARNELLSCWKRREKIREKQKTKPRGSALAQKWENPTIACLKSALVEQTTENVWSSFNAGIERSYVVTGKTWRSGGMSDAEWLERQLGLTVGDLHDAEKVKAAIPGLAERLVDEIIAGEKNATS
jgi:hypothetical protein